MDDLNRLREEVSDLRRRQEEIGERLLAIEKRLEMLCEGAGETAPPAAAPRVAPPSADRPAPSVPGQSLESRIGGIWLNRVGVVAFILGAAYFLKHAFDQGWIGELTRVLIGVGAGLMMMAVGERVRRRGFTGYAAGLTGGGIAILYFSTYAAFHFYDLLPPAAALALMVVITTSAVILAVMQDAPAVAALGLLTGFLTPVLFATPDPSVTALFTYLLILNAGLATITCFRRWAFVGVLAFIFTHLMLLVPGLASFFGGLTPDVGTIGYQAFLAAFLLLFTAMAAVYAHRLSRPVSAAAIFVLTGAGAWHWLLSWLNLRPAYPDHMGYFTLGLAAMYVMIGFGLGKKPGLQSLSFASCAVSVGLLVVYVPVQLHGPWVTAGWIAQAGVLGWLGSRVDDRRVRAGAWMLLAISLFRILTVEWGTWLDPGDYTFLLNPPALLGAAYVGVLALTAWAAGRYRPGSAGAASEVRFLTGSAIFLFIAFLSMDIDRWGHVMAAATGEWTYYRNLSMMGVSLVWTSCAGALALAGFVVRQEGLRYAAMGLLGIAVLKVFLVDLRFLELIYRVISLVVLGMILLAVSYRYQLGRSRGEEEKA